jgi:hypothetical protein
MKVFEDYTRELDRANQKLEEVENEISEDTESFRSFLRRRQNEVIEGQFKDEDRFKDGVIAIYGDFLADHRELVEDFRHIDERLKGKVGQEILIISRREKSVLMISHSPRQTQIQTQLILGELSGTDLIFNYPDRENRNCLIPTYRYAEISFLGLPLLDEEGQVKVSNIEIANSTDHFYEKINLGIDLHADVGNWIPPFYDPPSSRLPALEILIGTEEIESWYESSSERYGREHEVMNLDVLRKSLGR